MKVILFGATGMVGQGVLRECLGAADVESVLSIVRAPSGQSHPKLREVLHKDFADYTAIARDLEGYDACFYCLGISSAGMSEADYTKITYEYGLAAARAIVERSPSLTFCFVSGAGTDATEQGRTMWARVKGKTENAIRALPFARTVMFRPGYIHPMHGVSSKTRLYRVFYALLTPIYPIARALAPGLVTTTENVGLAMLQAARVGADKPVLENADINALATRALTR